MNEGPQQTFVVDVRTTQVDRVRSLTRIPRNGRNAPKAELRVVVAAGIAQSVGRTGDRSENVGLWRQAGGERLTTSPLRISTAAFVVGLLLAVLCLFVTLLLTIWLDRKSVV